MPVLANPETLRGRGKDVAFDGVLASPGRNQALRLDRVEQCHAPPFGFDQRHKARILLHRCHLHVQANSLLAARGWQGPKAGAALADWRAS